VPSACAFARCLLFATVFASLSACAKDDDTSLHTFAGTTVRIIVGFAPGGYYDLHARLLAAHLGRHLPGHPVVVVENMPGAGGKLASNYLTQVARPDGLTIAHVPIGSPAEAVQSLQGGQLQLLGSPAPLTSVVLFSARSGITNIDDWRRASPPPRIASSGPGSPTFVVPHLATRALGLPIQLITGYGGSAEMRAALEGGEVDGIVLSSDVVGTILAASPTVRAVLRFSHDPLPGIDAPDALSYVAAPESRILLETGVYDMSAMIRVYVAPGGVPATRIALLRDGIMRTLADPQLRASATAAGVRVEPVAAEVLEQRLRVLATRTQALDEINTILSGR
jgi:tripartite-type tricarboxylate transporter receptor subunit TctC